MRSFTRREGDVFWRLMRAAGRVVRVETFMARVFGRKVEPGYRLERGVLHVHIHNIRVKLGALGACIVNERGVGYRLRGRKKK